MFIIIYIMSHFSFKGYIISSFSFGTNNDIFNGKNKDMCDIVDVDNDKIYIHQLLVGFFMNAM